MAIQIIREITADVVKRGTVKAVNAKQNDLNSRFINVRIQEDGKNIIVDPSLTVILNVERPDKQHNMFYGKVNDDGTVRVPFTAWMLELPGTLSCDIALISADNTTARLSTMSFNINVEAAVVSDESFIESDEYSVIVDLLKKADTAAEAAKGAVESAQAAAESAKAVEDAAKSLQESAEEASKFVDEKIDKVPGVTTNNFAQIRSDGSLEDSGINKETILQIASANDSLLSLACQAVGATDGADGSELVTVTTNADGFGTPSDSYDGPLDISNTLSFIFDLSTLPNNAYLCYVGDLAIVGVEDSILNSTYYSVSLLEFYAIINGVRVDLPFIMPDTYNGGESILTTVYKWFTQNVHFNFVTVYGRPLTKDDSLTIAFKLPEPVRHPGNYYKLNNGVSAGTLRYIGG